MKTLYFDCGMGAAGDMLMASLYEICPDKEKFLKMMNGMGLPGISVEAEPSVKCGITGTHMKVTIHGEEEESVDVDLQGHEHHHDHDEDHHHTHDHEDSHHTHDHHHDHEDHEHHHHDHEEHEHEHHHHDGECSCGCGHHHHHDHEGHHHADEVFTSWGKETIHTYTKDEVSAILKTLEEDGSYGNVLRAKGMVAGADGEWIYFDMVPEEHEVRTGAPEYTGRICVIGAELNEDKLAELFKLK